MIGSIEYQKIIENLEETKIVESHVHNRDRFFGRATVPNGEIHVADRIGICAGPFQIDAGDNDFGQWLLICGSGDTPLIAERYWHDFSKIQITGTERNSFYIIQIAFGASGDAAYLNEDYTELLFNPTALTGRTTYIDCKNPRLPNGMKLWARCKCPLQNTSTLDFYWGAHSYPAIELE